MALPPSLAIDARGRRVSLDPRDPAFVQDPYSAYEAIRAVAPFFFWEQYGIWCSLSHEVVTALLRDRRFGREVLHVATREELGWPPPQDHLAPFDAVEAHSMLEREPPVHTRLRNLVNRAFVSRQVERLRPRVVSLAHELIDRIEPAGEAELIEAFATPIPIILITELLGVPTDAAPDLLAWSHRMVAMYQFRRSRAEEDRAVAATEAFVGFLGEVIEARRRDPRDDLVSHLIAAEAEGDRLSFDELVSTLILLLNAGHEATVHAIGNATSTLLRERAQVASAFTTDSATEIAVEELLRFDPPLHLFTRFALQPVAIGGTELRTGDSIGLLLGAANRDPARFSEPDRLLLGRTGAAHVSFGGGIHFCVGAPLARLELQVALPILFERLPGLRLAAAPAYRDAYHFHGLEALRVAW